MGLEQYHKKRSFKKTPEPRGAVSKRQARALRFVVQKHAASHLHYDFRLELDGVLKSWAVPKGPSMNPSDKRLAMMTEDHPLSYATFAGVIPRGEYGAGVVEIWDHGVYSSTDSADPQMSRRKIKSGLHKREIKFVLYGEKLKGGFVLVHMEGREENAWLLIKERDEYAQDQDTSSGKDPMPHEIKPMLATLVDEPFDREGYLFETKWDGYRAVSEVKRGRVKLYSRNNLSLADAYAPVVQALKRIPHDCVLDGEIIALKGGRADFHALQAYAERKAPLRYMLFDLLYIDGEDLRARPLIERKRRLEALIPKSDVLQLSDHIEGAGKKLFSALAKRGVEGIVAKDGMSPYREGKRTKEWLKVKSVFMQEAIIVGYTAPRGSRKKLGALVLAAYEKARLRYIGHSGGGFTDRELGELHTKLAKIKTQKSPFSEKITVNSTITWVRPKYVCEIKFSEWTPEGHMRHPIFLGVRLDKKPKDVSVEHGAKIKKEENKIQTPPKLSHIDKVFWPPEGYTKGDLLAYYESISDILLPYLKDRPQNLNRHPNGVNGKNFFQKNFTNVLPEFVQTTRIWSDSNDAELTYLMCQNKETLLYMVNLGCIELNPWSSRVGALEHPDYLILDLDPHERTFEELIVVAREVKKVLDRAGVTHYPKTSGKSGLHIVVPLGARYRYDEARAFAELVMRMVQAKVPELTTIERNPKKRGGRMYLDYLQNRFGQTLACAYSVRPYPGATVSAPLEWQEVRSGLSPAAFTMRTMAARLKKKGDLWRGVLEGGADLSLALRRLEGYIPNTQVTKKV